MHAYLLVGREMEKGQASIINLAKKLQAKIMEFPLLKIGDVRNLNNLIRLSFKEPTLVVCKNIHEAGEEALNAFLKNLEEPQDNIYFALTAPSARKVLPTIVSRCQIIKVISRQPSTVNNQEIEDFLKMSVGQKLSYTDKIKDRIKAIEFAENMVNFVHRSLHENRLKYSVGAEYVRLALKTLSRLKANGNVNLQLSNLAIQISSIKV